MGQHLKPGGAIGPLNAADYEAIARERLDSGAWAYLAGGAADEITLAENRAAWSSLRLLPRVLRELAGGDAGIELLGRRLASPLLVAPVAHQKLFHADGELASALAAAAQGVGFVLSTQTSVALERVAAAVRDDPQRGPLWFQLYWQAGHGDRGFVRALLARAEQAGYEAIVLTVDAATSGVRDRERRAGFVLPPSAAAVHLADAPARARRELAAGASALFGDLLHDAPTWRDVEWLRGQTRLPLLLKGVLHADDARRALDLGVAGLIVSNHGGRTLDTAVATAHALPRIADALGGALPLLVDGGIRRGTDVLKALALGARAVLVGRPIAHALAAGGAPAVAHLLRLLRDEFEAALALTGCRSAAEAGPGLLWTPAHRP